MPDMLDVIRNSESVLLATCSFFSSSTLAVAGFESFSCMVIFISVVVLFAAEISFVMTVAGFEVVAPSF